MLDLCGIINSLVHIVKCFAFGSVTMWFPNCVLKFKEQHNIVAP